KRKAFDLRFEAAQTVREFLRKHGNSAVGEIDRSSSSKGFPIERRILFDVVSHVGNVHTQKKISVLQPLNVYGIVKVFGSFTVNSHDGQCAEIHPAFGLGEVKVLAEGFNLPQDPRRKIDRNLMLANDDFHINPKVTSKSQDFHHPAP